MGDHLAALRSSVARLRTMSEGLDDRRLVARAYPTEWTIADVLSHIGSGAVIMRRRIDDGLRGAPTPEEFAPSVWDQWNAKSPRQKADDALAVDGELLGRMTDMGDEDRARLRYEVGPLEVDFDAVVRMRLSEHALHSWDIAVVLDPAAVLAADAAAELIDHVELVARYTATPTGSTRTIVVRTTEPTRSFAIGLVPDRVTFAPDDGSDPDLELPAEAFIRLVYGRLDPEHTPAFSGDPERLAELRRVFPGP
jgi:uncharacterized protein (TIGR03083 family)